jgi:hypothetical protein
LPNGSALDGSTSQVLEPQQHGEHSFELAVEMQGSEGRRDFVVMA